MIIEEACWSWLCVAGQRGRVLVTHTYTTYAYVGRLGCLSVTKRCGLVLAAHVLAWRGCGVASRDA